MAAPVDIKAGSRRRCFDDDAGALYLGNDDDNAQDRHKIDLNKRSLEKIEDNLDLESKKEQPVAGSSMRTMESGSSEVCEADASCQQQKQISGTLDELEMRSPDRIFLTNDDEDDETSDSHHFLPLTNLQNATDVLEDEDSDVFGGFATCCLQGEKDGGLLTPRTASFNVSFQRTSLHRSQTCPAISTSSLAQSQVVALCRAVDDSHASVVLPTGFSQMWLRARPQTSVNNYGSSQKARKQRSYSFSNEKDVHYQQQQQQQHYLHQQMLQQQRTTMAGRGLPKRDRSYSESDVRWLQHKEMGRELRRMSDEFANDRSRKPLMTVREEDEDSSVGSHYSSSYPETVGTHHWF